MLHSPWMHLFENVAMGTEEGNSGQLQQIRPGSTCSLSTCKTPVYHVIL